MKSAPLSPRRVVNVVLTPRAQQIVGQAKQETGITQVALLERLLEWYTAQDPRVRTMILSPYPQVRRGLAKLVLEELHKDPGTNLDALPKFDGLIDHDYEAHERDASNRPTVTQANSGKVQTAKAKQRLHLSRKSSRVNSADIN